LEGVKGAIPTWDTGNWDLSPGNTYTLGTATKEYEICFKCHSASNANLASTWSPAAGATAWTDVGLEFNPNNLSYHPIVQASPNALLTTQLAGGWAPGDTMYCSDCHASDSTRAGPHGSAVKWMLAGTNKAWPYYTANSNGTATADNTRGNSTYKVLGNEASFQGTNNGLFCLNCHPNPNTTGNFHSAANHRGGLGWYVACVDCHIRVPHGGKLERLICADGGGLPARYYPNGAGGDKIARGTPGGSLTKFRYQVTTYTTADCTSGCTAAIHNSGLGTSW
ncbi:MAG: CxxxxCH/CxxCH domain-containing protein, partial [Proteobacteria bacterium]|nr:CxxxxCH/CxxCH domain-containing protein [Pseudomonadota bacterium]MBU1710741.1 CxxxxCH/CxxCH domain-containing protein [Pseudomonadota bacterium]